MKEKLIMKRIGTTLFYLAVIASLALAACGQATSAPENAPLCEGGDTPATEGQIVYFNSEPKVCVADEFGNGYWITLSEYIADMTPPASTPTNTPELEYQTQVPSPTSTGTPTATTSIYCIGFGGNEGVPGNVEMVWLESLAALTTGHHYQYPWKDISNVTKIGNTTVDPYWEGDNDTVQGIFCKINGQWLGWIIPRGDAYLNFYDGISFAQLVGERTLRVYVDDKNGVGSGKYSDLDKLYTFDEARNAFGDLTEHIDNAELLSKEIDAGRITLEVKVLWMWKIWQK